MKSNKPYIPSGLEQVAIEKASQVNPEFKNYYGTYAMLVPEFSPMVRTVGKETIEYPMSDRAAEKIRGLAFDSEGKELSLRKIKNNVAAFIVKTRALIKQLMNNPVWLAALEEHERREDFRLEKEGKTAEIKGKLPGDLTRMMRRRFVADSIKNTENGEPLTYAAAPRNSVKMVQDVVCSDVTKILLIGDFERSNLTVEQTREVDNKRIDDLVIDPEKVTDTLLRNLGLESYIAPKRSKHLSKLSGRCEAIEAVRGEVQGLRPLRTVSESQERDNYFRTYYNKNGYLLGTSNTGSKKLLFRADLVDAVNRLRHIEEGYREEISGLKKIIKVVTQNKERIRTHWQELKSSGELERIKLELLGLVEELRFVGDNYKKEMRDLIEGAVSMTSTYKRKKKDAEGKLVEETVTQPNPGANMTRLTQVPEKAGKRIDKIARISSYLAKDRIMLESTLVDHEAIPFAGIYEHMEKKAREVKKAGPVLEPGMSEEGRKELIGRLEEWQRKFLIDPKKPLLQPFKVFVEQILKHFEETRKLADLPKPNKKELARSLTRIYLVAKLQLFWNSLQNIYERHLAYGDKAPYFLQLKEELVNTKNVFQEKRITKNLRFEDFDGIYHNFYDLLNVLIIDAEAGRLAMVNHDKEQAMKIKEKMYAAVKGVDIVKLISALGKDQTEQV